MFDSKCFWKVVLIDLFMFILFLIFFFFFRFSVFSGKFCGSSCLHLRYLDKGTAVVKVPASEIEPRTLRGRNDAHSTALPTSTFI